MNTCCPLSVSPPYTVLCVKPEATHAMRPAAQLHFNPGAHLLDAASRKAHQMLHQYTLQELSHTLWALAVFEHHPGKHLQQACAFCYQQRWSYYMAAACVRAQEISNAPSSSRCAQAYRFWTARLSTSRGRSSNSRRRTPPMQSGRTRGCSITLTKLFSGCAALARDRLCCHPLHAGCSIPSLLYQTPCTA